MTNSVSQNFESIMWAAGSTLLVGACAATIVYGKARKAYPGLSCEQSVERYLGNIAQIIRNIARNCIPEHVRKIYDQMSG